MSGAYLFNTKQTNQCHRECVLFLGTRVCAPGMASVYPSCHISTHQSFPGSWGCCWDVMVMSSFGSCFAQCGDTSACCSSAMVLPSNRGCAAGPCVTSIPVPGLAQLTAGGKHPYCGGRRHQAEVAALCHPAPGFVPS